MFGRANTCGYQTIHDLVYLVIRIFSNVIIGFFEKVINYPIVNMSREEVRRSDAVKI